MVVMVMIATFRVCIPLNLWGESIAGRNAVKALNHCLSGVFDCLHLTEMLDILYLRFHPACKNVSLLDYLCTSALVCQYVPLCASLSLRYTDVHASFCVTLMFMPSSSLLFF